MGCSSHSAPRSEPSARGWHPGRGLCWLPVLPSTPPLQGKRCGGVPGSPCSAHGSGRCGNVHGAMSTQPTGTKSKLCSAVSIQNPPHLALLLQAVPCPCCSENPPAPGSPSLPALMLLGFSFPTTAPQHPWPVEGLPSQGDRQRNHRALSVLMASALLCPAPSLVSPLFPPAHCTTDTKHPHSGLQGPESAAVNHSGSRERHENGVSQPSLLPRQLGGESAIREQLPRYSSRGALGGQTLS